MKKSPLPNWLSTLRIVLAPAALTAALAGSKPWFIGLLAAGLLTDAIDGIIARHLKAETDFGRKLDSAADYVTMLIGIAGIALLWPDIMKRELPWVIAALGAFFAVIVYGFLRLGRAPCYHTWAAKVFAVACALSIVPLLAEWAAWPFHAAISLQILGGVEEMVIVLLLPEHRGEMPTVWHAWRQRRRARAGLNPPQARS
ncbi:MAG: CDP-alcohol phosphatidyltransferase family protein [Opitutaceae bacterium]|nr:CDP-alcohol phosphatidyltransferase family protein [Opitutaceae bacterium]MBP9913283.1 CDP-alcohol phosphatidyltransferase family protein [Opitutaceae bacterium]